MKKTYSLLRFIVPSLTLLLTILGMTSCASPIPTLPTATSVVFAPIADECCIIHANSGYADVDRHAHTDLNTDTDTASYLDASTYQDAHADQLSHTRLHKAG